MPLLDQLRTRRVSPVAYRRVTLFAVWALGFIIVTGAAVRLTGSGLGCPDWPTCSGPDPVAPWEFHAVVEFGNRVVTAAVSSAVIAAVLASRRRAPRRRDLSGLSWGLVAGVVGQIVLGGASVRHKLAPPFIMGHFLLSMVLLADAVVLHHRAGFGDGPPDAGGRATPAGRSVPMVPHRLLIMGRLLAVPAALTILLGTVVTSSGPHGGDPKAPRLDLSLREVARLHSSAALLFLAFSVVTLWAMHRAGAPAAVMRRGELLLGVLVAQGAVGYIQYFSGDQAWLVAIHVTLATALWGVSLHFVLGLRTRTGAPATSEPPREPPSEGRVLATA